MFTMTMKSTSKKAKPHSKSPVLAIFLNLAANIYGFLPKTNSISINTAK